MVLPSYPRLHASLPVDIVEGMVDKGIYLNGDQGGTFLHFGSYENSCISDPMQCGPEGKVPVGSDQPQGATTVGSVPVKVHFIYILLCL